MLRSYLSITLLLVSISAPLFAADRSVLLTRLNQLASPHPDLIGGIKTADQQTLDHYGLWLDWVETQPGLLGQVNYRNEPLVAGSRQTLEVTFRPGMDIEPGGRILVTSAWQNGISLQVTDAQSGNFIRATTQSSDVTDLKPVTTRLKGAFGGWFDGRGVTAFEVVGTAIRAGEEVTFELRNVGLPGQAGPLFIPVFFSLGPNQKWFGAPLVELSVRPALLDKIQVIGPSRLGRGQSTSIKVILEDQFGNPTAVSTPALDVIVDGVFLRRIKPVDAVTVVEGIQFSEPGLHSVQVRTGGGGTRGQSNPIVVQSGSRQILWADLHGPDASSALDLGQQAQHDSYLIPSIWQPDGGSHWIRDGELKSGGSRLVMGDWNNATDWRALPNAVQVALPFYPVDERSIDSSRLLLVEIASGDSVFEWYANRFYQAGYRMGVTASASSMLPPIGPEQPSALTAVIVEAGQSIDVGLRQRATYATTGNRMVIHSTVNGSLPGRRIGASQSRSVSGWVQGTAPIERIELIKNGVVVDTLNVAGDTQSQTLKVSLFSSSAPYFGQRDFPRNGREWIGYLKASSASMIDISAPGFRNGTRQAIAKNGASRVDFITWTHGSVSSFMVTFANLAEDGVIELNLKAGHEDSDIEPLLRSSSTISANRQMVPVFDLLQGPVEREVKVNGYKDQIRFELVNQQAADYMTFNFADTSPSAEEDYYYIRVQQIDDHRAWSSPVFVGGFDAP
jgi:hypothetical protein